MADVCNQVGNGVYVLYNVFEVGPLISPREFVYVQVYRDLPGVLPVERERERERKAERERQRERVAEILLRLRWIASDCVQKHQLPAKETRSKPNQVMIRVIAISHLHF